MTSAAFSIDGTSVPQATGLPVTTTYGATVALAVTSVVGAVSIAWSIVGVSAPTVATPTITPAGTPLGATASFTVCADPGTGSGVCYGVRCRVTDGAGQVFDHYGLVGVAATVGFIPFVAGESGTWAHATMGWTPRMNALITALAGVVGPQGATGSTGPTGPAGSSGAQGPQGDPGYAATVALTSVPVLYVGTSATVAVTVTENTVWQTGLHGYYIESGVGTGASQNVVFTPSADHAGSGNITLLGEGNGDYESAYVFSRTTPTILGSQASARTTDTGADYTVSYTCHAGTQRKLIVHVGADGATPSIGGVTYNGNAMTLIGTQASGSTDGRAWAYYIDDAGMPESGAANIVVDVTSTHTSTTVVVLELDYAWPGDPPTIADDQVADTAAITTSVNNSLVVNVLTVGDTGTMTLDVGVGGTITSQANGDTCRSIIGYVAVPTAGVTAMEWQGNINDASCMLFEIAPGWG